MPRKPSKTDDKLRDHKRDLVARWRKEGRYPEVWRFLEITRRECLKNGSSKEDAVKASWEEAEKAFPPMPELVKPKAIAPRKSLVRRDVPADWPPRPGSVSWDVEVNWAYENYVAIERYSDGTTKMNLSKCISPAPSEGAITLLELAADQRMVFFKEIVPRVKARPDVDAEGVKRERKSIEEIRKILKRMEEMME